MNKDHNKDRPSFLTSNFHLFLALGLFTTIFVVLRIPWLHCFEVRICPDTRSYCKVVGDFLSFSYPDFRNRSPGYPLFLTTLFLLYPSFLLVVLCQMAFYYLSSVLLIFTASRINRWLSFPMAIAVCCYPGLQIRYETWVITDALFLSFLSTSFAVLFFAMRDKRHIWLLSTSILFAATILIRPAGVFLLVSWAMAILYFCRTKTPIIKIGSFFMPFAVILISLCSYNYFQNGFWGPSQKALGEMSLLTHPFWETSEKLSRKANDSIIKMQTDSLAKESLATLKDSSDLDKLLRNTRHYANWRNYRRIRLGKQFPSFGSLRKNTSHAVRSAIRNHPEYYLKVISANLYYLFFPFPHGLYHRHCRYESSSSKTRLENWSRKIPHIREYKTPSFGYPSLPFNQTSSNIILALNWLSNNWVIRIIYLAVFAFSMLKSLISRFEDTEAVFVFLVSSAFLGGLLLCALTGRPILRYFYDIQSLLFVSIVIGSHLMFRVLFKSRTRNDQGQSEP